MTVNGARHVHPLSQPGRVGLRSFDAGPLVPWLSTAEAKPPGERPRRLRLRVGRAVLSGDARAVRECRHSASSSRCRTTAQPRSLRSARRSQWLAREQANAAAAWRSKLDRVTIRVPPEAQPLADTLHTALAHILITRDGPRLRPGTRAYARSWIRDGTMIAESLLRLGHARRRGRLPALVRAASVRQRQGAVLRRCARRRSGSRKRQPGRVHLPRWRGVPLYARSRAARRRCGRTSRRLPRYMERAAPSERVAGRERRTRPRCTACCPHRSATKAIRRSRCTRTGTTSGR